MDSILSIIASIASILAAGLAFRESGKAARSASAAERVRIELVTRRTLAEVAQIQSDIRRVLSAVSRVGPTSTRQLVRGLDCAAIAREVEEFLAKLLEHRGHFSDLYSDRATELRNELTADIEGLAEATTFEDKKRFGKSIYYKIENFVPVVKQLADFKIDQTPNP